MNLNILFFHNNLKITITKLLNFSKTQSFCKRPKRPNFAPKLHMDDQARHFCPYCPYFLNNFRHELFHSLLLKLHKLIENKLKYDEQNSKPSSRAYAYKLKQIHFLHDLAFCATVDEYLKQHVRLRKLVNEIMNLPKKAFARKKQLRIRIWKGSNPAFPLQTESIKRLYSLFFISICSCKPYL